ncbi:MAG: ParA family protein [Oscillospiraceae bacterium]|nr:ParA family protein [Oscillospiraceae bacterium]
MTNRVMFAIQKGGVGKTTSTVAVSEILAELGYRVLVVDFDSQGNATRMLTGNSIYKYTGHTIMEAIQIGKAENYIIPVKNGLDLIPAEDKLATFSRYIYTSRIDNPYAVLKRLLDTIEDRYDFVFIDVGPTLGDHMINAIVYADRIFIPIDTGDLGLDAMVRYIEFVNETRAEGHTNAVIDGVLLTMRDGRSRYEREISEAVRASYDDLVFKTEVRRLVKIKEMSSKGVDIIEDAMGDYIALTEEIIEKIYGKEKTIYEQQED